MSLTWKLFRRPLVSKLPKFSCPSTIYNFIMNYNNNKIMLWNCRGAAGPGFYRNCKQFLDVHRPDMLVVMELRTHPSKLLRTFQLLGFDGVTFSEGHGFAGGIIAVWKTDLLEVETLITNFQFIHMKVCVQRRWSWYFTAVYASPDEELRSAMWRDLSQMASAMRDHWFLAGDFNDIISATERRGGKPVNQLKCNVFSARINACNLVDLGAVGPRYTWRGQKLTGYSRTYQRLDRALCNDSWRITFPDAFVKVLPRVKFSDHHPILISPFGTTRRQGVRPFRFESAWMTHPSFVEDLNTWWLQSSDFSSNLQSVEHELKGWKTQVFGDVVKKKKELLARLGGIQNSYKAGRAHLHLERLEVDLQNQLEDVLYKEELMWHQRSRSQWLLDGDRNTRYYHIKATNRKKKNKIHMLKDEQGDWVEDEEQIKHLATDYFRSLFREEGTHSRFHGKFHFDKIDSQVVSEIDRPITNEEIKAAIFSMGGWKSPGPDGFPAGFYHGSWNIIAPSFSKFIRGLWMNPREIGNVNFTDIVLIPKVDKPEYISQFRPISLCNVSYKVLTKIVVQRLKPFIPDIISPYQTGFVPTRSIHENIVVAQEMVHSMNKMRGKTGFFAIKVDLAKAYDRLRWSFIHEVLLEIGFPSSLIHVIMHCVTSAKTNVLWNGNRSEFFSPERGIRQGDPMSPYLFVLCMDKLTHLIAEEVENGQWIPLKAGRSGPPVSHLMFADDLLLFGKATESQMNSVVNTLNRFSDISGQMVSLEKTSILFSKNVDTATRRRLVHLSGFKETRSLGKYLGVPLIGRAPKRRDFDYLMNKVRDRLSGWKSKQLSFAGRVTLSKSVIQAIPVYSMMTIPIPKSCLNDIQKLQRDFIWGDSEDHKRHHMINWNTITLPKDMGGLGVRDLKVMNSACMMKMGWALRKGGDSLWSMVLKGKYGRGLIDDGRVEAKATDSFIWKAVVMAWNEIDNLHTWAIGNGESINVWRDNWIDPHTRLADIVQEIPHETRDWNLSDLIVANRWNISQLGPWVPQNVINRILAIPTPSPSYGDDHRVWAGVPLTVASAYKRLRAFDVAPRESWWKRIWKLQVPERVRCFLWKISHGKLLTAKACSRWGNGEPWCCNCTGQEETILHVLRDCEVAVFVWQHLLHRDDRSWFFLGDVGGWAKDNLVAGKMNGDTNIWPQIWATTCYFLWLWRNKAKFDPNFQKPPFPSRFILQQVKEYGVTQRRHRPMSHQMFQWVDVLWVPPESSWWCLNTDAAVVNGFGEAACGGVVRREDGSWVFGFARSLGIADVTTAELWSAFDGLSLARERGIRRLKLQMDSKDAVDLINGRRTSANLHCSRLVDNIQLLMGQDWSVNVCHIFRQANRVADRLAQLGFAIRDQCEVFDSPPSEVQQLLDADVIGVSTPRIISV